MKPKEVRNQIEPALLIATEVLDADAFDAFVEVGDPFDAATAERLHRYVHSAGNTIEPRVGYAAFRGRAASVEPMLKKKGLLETV